MSQDINLEKFINFLPCILLHEKMVIFFSSQQILGLTWTFNAHSCSLLLLGSFQGSHSGTCFVVQSKLIYLGLVIKQIFLLKYKTFSISTYIWETKADCLSGNTIQIFSFSLSFLLCYVVKVELLIMLIINNTGGIISASRVSDCKVFPHSNKVILCLYLCMQTHIHLCSCVCIYSW